VSRFLRKASLLVAALTLLAVTGAATPNAFAGSMSKRPPATTTTLSPRTIAAGRAYATQRLEQQPVPPGARLVDELPTPLTGSGEGSPGEGLRDVAREYLLPASVDVNAFVRSHLRVGESVNETGSGTRPNENPTYYIGAALRCISRHVTYCGVTYETTMVGDGQQELRIDLEVEWLPIVIVKMPTNGVVSVTGYGDNSLPMGSSDPFTVVLSHSQAVALRTDISKLKTGTEGLCTEDEQLLTISVTSSRSNAVVWRATADVCPGTLSVDARFLTAQLNDHSCALWQLVRSFFPTGKADATKGAIGFCGE
jgi:hypothetical protein